MPRLLRLVGIALTVGLVGYAAFLLLGDPEVDEVVQDAIADARDSEGELDEIQENRERLQAVARGMSMSPEGGPVEDGLPAEVNEVPAPAIDYGSGELDPATVRDSFDYAMKRVDAVGRSRKRITVAEWDKLYREANDAFSALAIVLDPQDEAQAAELEAAHKRLKQSLKRVRVRGRKFGT